MSADPLRDIVEATVRRALEGASGAAAPACPCPAAPAPGPCPCSMGMPCPCPPGACTCAHAQSLKAAAPMAAATPPPAAALERRVTMVFTGAERGEREGRILLQQISRDYPVRAVIAPCYGPRHGEKWLREDGAGQEFAPAGTPDERDRLLRAASVLVLPHPTRADIARLATGVADTIATELVMGALMSGVPVAMGTGDAEAGDWPATAPVRLRSGPQSLGVLMKEYLRTLEGWGVEVRRGGELLRAVEALASRGAAAPAALAASMPAPGSTPAGRRFFTAGDIRRMAADGQGELTLGPGDRITDEARTVAADLGIKIR